MNKVNYKYLGQEALLLIVLSYLLILEVANRDMTIFPLLVASTILFSGIVISWLIWGQWTSWKTMIPFLLWMILAALSILTSFDSRRSASELGIMLLTIVVFLLSMDLVAHGWKPDLIVRCLLIVGAIAVCFTWYGVFGWYRYWLAVSPGDWLPDIPYRLPSPNVQAWNFNALMMLIGGKFLFEKSKGIKVVLLVYGIATAGLIYLTSSRSGWIATGLGLIVLLVLYAKLQKFDWKVKLLKLKNNRLKFNAVVFFSFVVIILAGYLLYRQALHPSHGSLLKSRYEFWEPAIATFLSHPITGQGLFTFSSALINAHSTPPFGIYLHAHSIPLTILAESGVIGISLLVILIVWLINLIIKRYRTIEIGSYASFTGIVAALSAAAVHSLFDSFIGKSLGTLVLAIAAGAVFSQPGERGKKISRPIWALLLPAFYLGLIWVGHPMVLGASAADKQNWGEAETLFSEAVKRDPNLMTTWQQKGIAEAVIAFDGEESTLAEAITSYEKAVEIDPYWSLNHLNLGALYYANGDLGAAEESLFKATQLAPENFLTHFNLANLEEEMGNLGLAEEEYVASLNIVPEYQDSAFWSTTTTRIHALSVWTESLEQPMQMTFDEKLAALDRRPDDGQRYLWVAEEYLNTHQFKEADRILEKSNFAFTMPPMTKLRILQMRADIAAYQKDFPNAITLGNEALNMILNQGMAGPGTNQGVLYNQLAFRSNSAPEELIPQVRMIIFRNSDKQFIRRMVDWYKKVGNLAQASELEALLHQFEGLIE